LFDTSDRSKDDSSSNSQLLLVSYIPHVPVVMSVFWGTKLKLLSHVPVVMSVFWGTKLKLLSHVL